MRITDSPKAGIEVDQTLGPKPSSNGHSIAIPASRRSSDLDSGYYSQVPSASLPSAVGSRASTPYLSQSSFGNILGLRIAQDFPDPAWLHPLKSSDLLDIVLTSMRLLMANVLLTAKSDIATPTTYRKSSDSLNRPTQFLPSWWTSAHTNACKSLPPSALSSETTQVPTAESRRLAAFLTTELRRLIVTPVSRKFAVRFPKSIAEEVARGVITNLAHAVEAVLAEILVIGLEEKTVLNSADGIFLAIDHSPAANGYPLAEDCLSGVQACSGRLQQATQAKKTRRSLSQMLKTILSSIGC